jgi:hypothetical protein
MLTPVTPSGGVLRSVAIRVAEDSFLFQKTTDLHFAGGGSQSSSERFKNLDVSSPRELLHKFQRPPVMNAIGIETNSVMTLAFEPIAEDGLADR